MNAKLLYAVPVLLSAGFFLFQAQIVSSQTFRARDPGVRGGDPGAGGPIAGLSATERAFFHAGKDEFEQVDPADEGLGPRMNLDSCGGCHAQPAVGGTSPSVNPQVAFANSLGATNAVPS